MAVCVDCEQEMTDPNGASCTYTRLRFADGEIRTRVGYSTRRGGGDSWAPDVHHRCHDCGVFPGGVHHFGCDVERCPRCHRQLITCGCPDEDSPIP
jgi:hypothetical protein